MAFGDDLPRNDAKASEDLWETAAASLGDDLKSVIEPSDGDRREILRRVLVEATQKQKQCLEKRWKIKNRKGDVIILRDVFEKIITSVNSFKGIGDSLASMGPGWAAIPWALVSVLLKVVVTDNETFATMIEGLERATKIISRYSVFEAVYLKQETAGTQQLRDSLVALYASVLTFLGESYYYFARNTARRFIKAFFSDSGVDELLDDLTAKQAEVDRDAQLVATEVLQSAAKDIRGISDHSTSITSQLNVLQTHLEQIQQSQLVVADLRALKDAISAMARPVQRIVAIAPASTDNLGALQRKAILDWLSPIPYRLQHVSERHRRLPDSGAWMFETAEYIGWRESSVSGTLWLHGMPGCGKTKLLSAVVDYELQDIEKHPGAAPVAYFYCSRNTAEPERSDPAEVLRSIARQLCGDDVSKPVPEQLRRVHQFLGAPEPGTAKLPLDLTIKLILDLLRENPATIILDALDECDPGTRHELFEALDAIVANAENVVKIFLTSRNDGDIVCRLASTPNIYINAQKNGFDIMRFIVTELDRVIAQKQLLRGQVPDRLKREITDTLIQRADGMFRWVTLQIQNLCDPRRMRVEGDVRAELGHLPKTLADLYSIAFDQVLSSGTESSKLAIKALRILLFAYRPFGWAEFLYLVALTDDGIRSTVSRDELLHSTCNFIEEAPEVDRVAFPHLSAREYLQTRPEFTTSSLHIAASQICLSAIRYPEPQGPGVPPAGFTYAILYIGNHLAELNVRERRKVKFLKPFLLHDAPLFNAYVERLRRIMRASGMYYHYDAPQVPKLVIFYCLDPLAMICLFGLEEFLAEAISQIGVQAVDQPMVFGEGSVLGFYLMVTGADKQGGIAATAAALLSGKSRLEMAVMRRNGNILRRLHDLGIYFGNPNRQGETILHLACRHGLDDMVRLLLSLGMDPNQVTTPGKKEPYSDLMPTRDPVGHRPASSLGFRARDGNSSGVISPFGTEEEIQYPIHLAIAPGKSIECVKALVEHGADSNVRTSRGATALQLSFEMGDQTDEITKLLLSRGADPNAEVGFGRTMLHLAAAMGLARIVPELVAAGGDVARRDYYGQTPWATAVRYGHTDVAEALAAAGGRLSPVLTGLGDTLEDSGDGCSGDEYDLGDEGFGRLGLPSIRVELETAEGSIWTAWPEAQQQQAPPPSKVEATTTASAIPVHFDQPIPTAERRSSRISDRLKKQFSKLTMKPR